MAANTIFGSRAANTGLGIKEWQICVIWLNPQWLER